MCWCSATSWRPERRSHQRFQPFDGLKSAPTKAFQALAYFKLSEPRRAATLRRIHPLRTHLHDPPHLGITIWNKWLPESEVRHDCKAVDAPDFERYGEQFDARTGMGGVEIWLPAK